MQTCVVGNSAVVLFIEQDDPRAGGRDLRLQLMVFLIATPRDAVWSGQPSAFPNGHPETLAPGEPLSPQPHPSCSACPGRATPY